jgi:hypothetical protein
MKIINFSIDSNLDINSETQFNFSVKKLNTSIYIFGDAIGAIIDNSIYDNKDFESYLKDHAEDIGLIKKLVRNSIGAFYIVISNNGNMHVLCSYSSPGLLYIKKDNKIYFSNTERDIFNTFGAASNVNEGVLLNTVSSHQILLRPPFTTVFTDILRLPSATGLIINSGLDVELDIQLVNEIPDFHHKSPSMKESVERFGFLLENTLKLIVDYYDNENLELFFSGGIDSSVLMIALKKVGVQFTCRHVAYSGTESQNTIIAKRIAKKLDTKILVSEKSTSANIKNIVNSSTSGFGTINVPQQLNIDSSSKAFGYDNTLNIITGQNADTLYYVDTFAPNSATFFPLKVLKTIRSLPYRIMYSDVFLNQNNNNNKWFLKLWPFSVNKKNIDFNLKQFITSITIPMGEHVVPLMDKIDTNDPMIDQIVKKHKYKNIFLPIHDFFVNSNNHIEIFQHSSSTQKISLIKIFRWYRTVNNVSINYHNNQISSDLNRLIPYTDGPLANFFIKRNLSLSEMFFIKRILYKYFKSEVHKNYSYFCKYKLSILFSLLSRKMLKIINLSKISNLKNTVNFSNELNILRDIRLADKRILLDFMSNQEIKDYFESLYNTLDKSVGNLSKKEMMILCRLVNLENMLFNLK